MQNHVHRQTIVDHMGSQKHTGIVSRKRRAEECAAGKQSSSKRQTTINGCVERQSAAAVAKDKLAMDVVESFMSANIHSKSSTIQSYGSFLKTQ